MAEFAVEQIAMVQVIENLTEISGRIECVGPHPSLAEYDVVTLSLADVRAVPGKADLLGQFRGTTIDVVVRRQLLTDAGAKPGAMLRCRARRTTDGAICEKVPARGDFSVQGP